MYLRHAAAVRAERPELIAGVLYAEGITAEPDVSPDAAIVVRTPRYVVRLNHYQES
jgi:hypothetical protein